MNEHKISYFRLVFAIMCSKKFRAWFNGVYRYAMINARIRFGTGASDVTIFKGLGYDLLIEKESK